MALGIRAKLDGGTEILHPKGRKVLTSMKRRTRHRRPPVTVALQMLRTKSLTPDRVCQEITW